MPFSDDAVLVLGHRSPDTDAIASAIGFAWLQTQLGSVHYSARRAGEINAQTAFALSRFTTEAPPLTVDVRTHVANVTESSMLIQRGETLRTAAARLIKAVRPLPLMDGDQPLGLISSASVFNRLARAFDNPTALAEALGHPVEEALETGGIVLKSEDAVHDILTSVLRSEADDFLVVDANGQYQGVCRKTALLIPPRARIVLVDHNEASQAVAGIEEADIVEIVDHHRLNSPATTLPIPIQIEPVGSCSTLVAERAALFSLEFPQSMAGLLLCGILSDTLVFKSPTCTQRDRDTALWLALQAGVVQRGYTRQAALNAVTSLGAELMAAGSGLADRTAYDLIQSDFKTYTVGMYEIGVGQVEVTTYSELDARQTDLLAALQTETEEKRLALGLLMVTDVLRGSSRILAAGQPRLIAALPYPRLANSVLDAPGMVSRKKQLLPAVLSALATV